ncbi:MAG: DUF4956 domain-containing protein [Candidatus Pelagibacter sp.]|tara:strand:+ start:50 stop:664 length:615 start_codon:yes stop_codon:yes gene_type:complete
MVENIIFLILSGLVLRFSLSITGQNWVKTYQQTIAFLILPVVTYVITKTITGNIALSLGMIGALSIVRFRNPVKSALELVMYFVLITIGIAASVNMDFAYILVATCLLVIGGTRLSQFILKKFFSKPFYNVSFNEGMSLNTIEIYSSKSMEDIEKNQNIKNMVVLKDSNEYIYRLSFENSKELNSFKDSIKERNEITKIDVSYV